MSLIVPPELEARIDRRIARYPERRSASLMVLHDIQEHLGHISGDAEWWIADKLGLQPIHIHELVTFYPMFRQQRPGRTLIRVCRTLSCALAGAGSVHRHLCRKLGLDEKRQDLQTTGDGNFSVECVECLATCGTAPVILCGDRFVESATPERVEGMLEEERVAAGHGFEP